jgi:type IV pilus assembly protein PilV
MSVSLKSRMQGFSLLEVLIAVLVFSFGLLGIAAMVLTSMRGTHTAQLHTQATFMAQWIADAMRANPRAVMAGNYDGPGLAALSTNCTSANCSPATLATRDREVWGVMVARALPAGQGTVACNLNSASRLDGTNAFPAGLCTVTLTWSEATDTEKTSATAGTAANDGRKDQQFVWIFNP